MNTKKLKAQRAAPRSEIEPLHVSSVSSLKDLRKVFKDARIMQASISGILLHVRRTDLVPDELRTNLSLEPLVGETLLVYIEPMNLEISGKVVRTKFLGKDGFHVALDYSADAPEYWRECLMDLLPRPGEFD